MITEYQNQLESSRRDFLTTSASGLGAMALGAMLTDDGVISSATAADSLSAVNPLAPRKPHFNPKAKACIFIFMAGRRASWISSTPSRS